MPNVVPTHTVEEVQAVKEQAEGILAKVKTFSFSHEVELVKSKLEEVIGAVERELERVKDQAPNKPVVNPFQPETPASQPSAPEVPAAPSEPTTPAANPEGSPVQPAGNIHEAAMTTQSPLVN